MALQGTALLGAVPLQQYRHFSEAAAALQHVRSSGANDITGQADRSRVPAE